MYSNCYEKLKMKKYTQIGGARIGCFNATWPFAKIEISENQIKLFVLGKSYEFQKEESLQLKKCHGLFNKGLQIKTTNINYPNILIFWSFNLKQLINNLEKMNYRIS